MGKILFIGGIAGLAVSLVLFVVVLVYLKKEKGKIQENLEKSYGSS